MEDFISHNAGATEPGVIIVANDADEEAAIAILSKHFFADARTIKYSDLAHGLTDGIRVFFSTEHVQDNPATDYDFIHGYATGTVRIVDKSFNPSYARNNVLLVLRRDFLDEETHAGRDWLSLCGMAFQYTA